MIVRKVVASATLIAAATIGGQAAASAATTSTAHPAARQTVADSARTYTVQPGDTLSGIAARFGISWKALYAANKKVIGPNPNRIFAGQVLTLPDGSAASPVQQLAPASGTPQQSEPVAGPGNQPASSPSDTQPASSPQPGQQQQSASSGGGSQVSGAGQSSFEQCVAFRESSDTPTDPDGLFGFLPSTWQELGYSGTAGQASAAEQQAAFSKAYAMWGTSPWAPYDGC